MKTLIATLACLALGGAASAATCGPDGEVRMIEFTNKANISGVLDELK